MTTTTTSSVESSFGPWHAQEAPHKRSMRSVRDDNDKCVAFINRLPRAAANERLILAAPRMHQILQRMFDAALPSATFRIPQYFTDAIAEVLREIEGESEAQS